MGVPEMDKENEGLVDLYANLFQTLDGLWFLKMEQEFGFDKAMEIDDAVWKLYGEREARRLVRFYQNLGLLKDSDGPLLKLKTVIGKSLFNKTLGFSIELEGNQLVFLVDTCKTLEGMKRVGRSDDQMQDVCFRIGFTFYQSFAKAIDERFTIECMFTPFSKETGKHPDKCVCGWKFSLPA